VRVAGIAAPEEQPNADARLESVYELHAARLRARCLRLTGDPLAAEDLMQEVFARFLARFPQLPESTNVEGYLLATARNIWINHARGQRRHPVAELDAARASDDRVEHDPVRSLLLREQRELVHEGARELTGRQRRALAMRELDGSSYAEIGNDLGIGANAVAQVLWRARAQLRRALRRSQVDVERLPAECRAMLDDMSDLVDRPNSGQAELEAHIEDCTTCRRTLASYQEAGAGFRGAVPFLPLLAVMGRAATAMRASVEASAGIGKVAAVTASVVATAAAARSCRSTPPPHPRRCPPRGRFPRIRSPRSERTSRRVRRRCRSSFTGLTRAPGGRRSPILGRPPDPGLGRTPGPAARRRMSACPSGNVLP
jgi:RNA polymerase sigma factor (sigma-70 family)